MLNGKTPGRRGRGRAGHDARIPGKFPALSALIRQEPPPPEPSAKSAAGTNGQADAKAQAKGGTGRRGPYQKIGLEFPARVPKVFKISRIIHIDEVKKAYLKWVLGQLEGNLGQRMAEAERLTGVTKRTMYNWFGGDSDERPDS
jgi:hypothetical protein